MNIQHAPAAVTASPERPSDTSLHGRWLQLARIGWGALVMLTLAVFFGSLHVYSIQLQTLCMRSDCASQQISPAEAGVLTPEQARVLKDVGLSLGDFAALTIALELIVIVVCLIVSTLITWRRSHNRMALLVALMLVTLGPIKAMNTVLASASPWRTPAACLFFLGLTLLVLVFSLFPSGQFVPRWTRWAVVVVLAALFPSTFFPNVPLTHYSLARLLGYFLLLSEIVILVVAQLYRYRRVSSPTQRQQTKWVVFGLAASIGVSVGSTILYLLFPALSDPGSPSGAPYQLSLVMLGDVTLLFSPLSFGFAMLRSRLWDIDVLINRALVYGSLTIILALVYVVGVIGTQTMVGRLLHAGEQQQSSISIAVTTLVIVALFLPLRRRLQAVIDRRFYRRKYDAERTLAAFGQTLRSEVDLEQLGERLLAVVEETMQPAHASLWLRPPADRTPRRGARSVEHAQNRLARPVPIHAWLRTAQRHNDDSRRPRQRRQRRRIHLDTMSSLQPSRSRSCPRPVITTHAQMPYVVCAESHEKFLR
jgi:hypothetical protein